MTFFTSTLSADNEAMEMLWQLRAQRRQSSPELPETVTRLTAPDGSLLYLVGTAHFSDSSKMDVATVSGLTTGCEISEDQIQVGPQVVTKSCGQRLKSPKHQQSSSSVIVPHSLIFGFPPVSPDDPGSAAGRGRGGVVPVSRVHVEDG